MSIYANKVVEWWAAMKASTKKKTQPFEHLRKGGPNGIVTLLLALELWRANIETENVPEWDMVVAEVETLFNNFNSNSTKQKDSPVEG